MSIRTILLAAASVVCMAALGQKSITAQECWLDGNFAARQPATATVDISGLAVGLHSYSVRVQDSEGLWSSAITKYFVIPSSVQPATSITACEYWLDGDIATRTTIGASPAPIDIADLAIGLHTFTIRAQDNNGVWSSPSTKYFIKEKVVEPTTIARYMYWFDDDETNRVIGELTEASGVLPITLPGTLADGTHTLSWCVGDSKGVWSNVRTETFNYIDPYVLQQDEDGNYLLSTVKDWQAFAELVNGGNTTADARMTADIDLGNDQTMIGTLSVPYEGTFDGQGHTLTVNYNQSGVKDGIGPFYVIGAATIQNLHVDGNMVTNCAIGGIAGIVKGNATIQRCWVSATMQAIGSSLTGTIGGICSVLEGVDDAHLTIEDCLFDGVIVNNQFCGGFMSHVERASCSVTMRRGLNIGTYPNTIYENGTFIREVLNGVRNLEASTLFHKKVFGKAQGTQVTDEQLADGSIAYRLQANRVDLVWGQRIGVDPEPVLTNDESYRVYISKNGGYTNNPEDAYEGLQQDEDGYYLLSTVQDMFAFAALVNDGNNTANAKVMNDIDLAGNEDNQWTPIGTESNKYKGTFDGQGYAIKNLYWHGNNQLNIGFFGYVDGAKIMNLRLEDADIYNPGQDGTTGKFVGGMVGHSANGNTLVINCSFSGSVTGMLEVGSMIGGGPAKVINCYNEGTVTFTSQTHYAAGGILGYNSNGITINNCYNVGDVINNGNPTDYMGAICYHGVTNSYYRENCCQNGSTAGWSNQGPGTVMNLDNMKTVVFVATLNANVASLQATYPDISEWVQDPVTNLPILKIFAKAHDLVENQLEQDEEGNYLIGSVQDWQAFAALVNGGSVTANAKMTADIDLGDDQTMVGIESVYYQGIFDGQGHTLTVHYVAEADVTAPFRFIQQATIKNLRVDGTITTAFHNAAGIVGSCYGEHIHSYIENCISSVNIISSYVNTNGDFYGGAMHGGIAAALNYYGQLHITDCIFNGSISGENNGVVWGGMLGIPDGTATFTNCLQIGTFGCNNVIGGSNGSGTFSTIFSNGYASHININNCHYLNAIGNIQGTQATVAQLADGTTANALQAGREEEIWVQNGTMPMLKLFASEIAPVEPSDWENGVLPGKFTINADGDKVFFSQGNLQYFCSTTAPEWRFAEHQYDYVPFDMSAYAENSEKWIDLFAHGTSGYDNGQTNYQPYVVGADPNTYFQGDLTGNAEWGYNAISNGGNTENFGWRTLTRDEWIYLFSGRTDAASKYGHGSINWVHGMILLPDEWTTPEGLSFTPGISLWQNAYTIEQWSLMEDAGAVFLPASGSCNNVGIPSESLQNQNGFYRASTAAYYVYFGESRLDICTMSFYQYGDAIRLVQAVPADPGPATGIEEGTGCGVPVTEKILRNGQILILRGDKIYNVVGTVVR